MPLMTGRTRARARTADDTNSEPRPARRAWWPWFATAGVVLVGLLWFAPAIVAATPLRNVLLAMACRDLDGTVTLDRLSLGWLSPIEAAGLEVRQGDGPPLALLPQLATEKTLWGLLADRTDLGRIRLVQPRFELVLRDGGSNVEDLLAGLLAPETSSSSPTPALALEVTDARLRVTDLTAGAAWDVEGIDAQVRISKAAFEKLELSIAAEVVQPEGKAPLEVYLAHTDKSDGTPLARYTGEARLQTRRLPLALCQSIVSRFAAGTQLSGNLDADLTMGWENDRAGPRQWCEGRVTAEQLEAISPWLAGDTLALNRLELPARLSIDEGHLRIDQAGFSCDVGQVSLVGEVPHWGSFLEGGNAVSWFDLLTTSRGRVIGRIDLARASRTLPRLLHLRDGLQVTVGQVALDVESAGTGNEVRWQGVLETSRVEAVDQGRAVVWDQPLRVEMAARREAAGLMIERLACESEFLQLQATGRSNAFELAAACDLNQLVQQLSQFVDLGGLRITGEAATRIHWECTPSGQFATKTHSELKQFELSAPGWQPWLEEQLVLDAAATGIFVQGAVRRVSSGELSMTSGGDELSTVLSGGVDQPGWQSSWPVKVAVQGELETWLARLGPWLPSLAGWSIEGKLNLTATGEYSPSQQRWSLLEATCTPLRAWGHGWYVNEPQVWLSTSGRRLPEESRIEIDHATAATASSEVRAQRLVLVSPASGTTTAAGQLAARGDLAQLFRWMQDPVERATWRWEGQYQAEATFDSKSDQVAWTCETTINQLLASAADGTPWREPQLKWSGTGEYHAAADRLRLERCALRSQTANVDVAGQIAQLSTARQLDLSGRAEYDLDRLSRLLAPYLGESVQLSGRQSQAFWLRGPLLHTTPANPTGELALAQLTAEAGFGWERASVFGLPLGRAQLDAQLASGLVRVKPTEIPVGPGRLRLAPSIRLTPEPRELTLEPGAVVERLQITPEMCSQALMYVAPVLAGATSVQGTCSLALNHCRVPLADPAGTDASGRLTVHSISIGPGPLVRELAVLLGKASPAELRREAPLDFRVAQGRVYHQNLELVFPELTIRTSGSVGFDRTLSLTADMPIPPKWLGNNALGSALKDQRIQLPIGGTLDRPRIDQRALDQAASQVIRNATDNALRNEVNRQLDRLFSLPGKSP